MGAQSWLMNGSETANKWVNPVSQNSRVRELNFLGAGENIRFVVLTTL